MSLVVAGLSHHTSDLALRERLAFPEEAVPKALMELRRDIDGAGAVILSTCNRSEIYAHHEMDPKALLAALRAFLARWHGLPDARFASALYGLSGREAVGHLFRVASSLDSLVVGEGQILGQVHDAYQVAHAEQATDKVINALFQKAFSVAKKVRDQSNIGSGKVSISSVAVDLAVSIFMDLSGKTVMVIGSGEMGELTLKSLVSRGVGHVMVVNRSLESAQFLAASYDGEATALDAIEDHLHRADIVISSTAAPGILLHADHFQRALRRRNSEPMFVIDIAVPRDIDPAVNAIDNVYLYDLDDLQEVAGRNMEARRAEVDRCLLMVDDGAEQFVKWLDSLAAEPTIKSLSAGLHAIRERELAKTLDALPGADAKTRAEIEYLTKRIVNNILQQPMSQLKQEVHHEDAGSVLQLVKRLFGLKETT